MTIDAELCCITEFQLMAEESEGRVEEIDGPESYASMKSTSATNIVAEEFERCASDRTWGTRHSRQSLT